LQTPCTSAAARDALQTAADNAVSFGVAAADPILLRAQALVASFDNSQRRECAAATIQGVARIRSARAQAQAARVERAQRERDTAERARQQRALLFPEVAADKTGSIWGEGDEGAAGEEQEVGEETGWGMSCLKTPTTRWEVCVLLTLSAFYLHPTAKRFF
jgi:hypothetical protein